MPVLQEDTCLFPANLLDGGEDHDEPSQRTWRLLYTKPRHEKSVARDLLAHEVGFYLPLQRKSNYYRGRRITSLLPVFASYVFAYTDDFDRDVAWKTNRIVSIMEVHDGEKLRRELCQIRRLIDSEVPITLENRIAPGERVRVHSGPLAGLEGIVLRRGAETRLVVAVDFLKQGASVVIDDYMVESV
jgi:hypothetical protein